MPFAKAVRWIATMLVHGRAVVKYYGYNQAAIPSVGDAIVQRKVQKIRMIDHFGAFSYAVGFLFMTPEMAE